MTPVAAKRGFALPIVLFTQFLLNLAIGIPLSAWIPYFRDGISVINAS